MLLQGIHQMQHVADQFYPCTSPCSFAGQANLLHMIRYELQDAAR